jgi:quercetin dioxygenase-like cupin family protein
MTKIAEKISEGFMERAGLENSLWYGSALISLLATGAQTQGAFAVLEGQARAGEDVPFHTHTHEDECFYMLDGEMTFRVGDQAIRAQAGDFIFLPRRMRHAWTSETNTRFLVTITPAGFETSFIEFSQPAEKVELPAPSDEPPPAEFLQALLARENELGVFYDFQQ